MRTHGSGLCVLLAALLWTVPGTSLADLSGSVGIGVIDANRFPGSDERRQRVIPVISAEYRDTFYFRFTRMGAWLWQDQEGDQWRLGPAVRPRFRVTPPPDLELEERDFTLDTGMAGRYRTGILQWSLSVFTDGFRRHRGHSADLGVSTFIPLGANARLLPSLTLRYEDRRINDFYYGTEGVPFARDTLGIGLSLLSQYDFSENWQATVGLFFNREDRKRLESPLVQARSSRTALAGVSWRW